MAEVATALGLISGAITVVESIKKIYTASNARSNLPEAFRDASDMLPIIEDTLQKAIRQIASTDLDTEKSNALNHVLQSTKSNLEKLKAILDKCVPDANVSTLKRYLTALRTLGKDHKVERLMKAILENIQSLVNNHSISAATEDQMNRIQLAIEKMATMEPSASDEMIDAQGATHNNHSGSGDIYSAEGEARQYVARDQARQYHANSMTFGSESKAQGSGNAE